MSEDTIVAFGRCASCGKMIWCSPRFVMKVKGDLRCNFCDSPVMVPVKKLSLFLGERFFVVWHNVGEWIDWNKYKWWQVPLHPFELGCSVWQGWYPWLDQSKEEKPGWMRIKVLKLLKMWS